MVQCAVLQPRCGRGDEHLAQFVATERGACCMGRATRQRHAEPPVGSVAGYPPAAPLCDPDVALRIADRAVGDDAHAREINKYLRLARRPSGAVDVLFPDRALGRVGEISGVAIGREADRIGDCHVLVDLANLAPEIAIDRARARFGIPAHRADPEAPQRIGAAIVGSRVGAVGFQRYDLFAVARCDVELP